MSNMDSREAVDPFHSHLVFGGSKADRRAALAQHHYQSDFRMHMSAGHPDTDLLKWISEGVPNMAIPPVAELPAEDRWHVINFIRAFATSDAEQARDSQPRRQHGQAMLSASRFPSVRNQIR